MGSGEHALSYLARYVFRVAISNSRIVSFTHGLVTFRYRHTETKLHKTCRLSAEEFLRRFLQHVLPKRFLKVRYYGLLAPRNRKLLEQARLLAARHPSLASSRASAAPASSDPRDPRRLCPKCHGPMQLIGPLAPTARAP